MYNFQTEISEFDMEEKKSYLYLKEAMHIFENRIEVKAFSFHCHIQS